MVGTESPSPELGAVRRQRSAARRPGASRRWSRGLAVLAVAAVCAVPATDALASGRGRSAPPPKAKAPAARQAAPAPLDVERESARRGWAWGQAVRGLVVTPTRTGVRTVQFQRGVISDITPTTIVVTSVDGVSITWSVGAGTAVVVPRAVDRRKNHPTATSTSATSTSTTTSTTTSSTTTTTEATTSTTSDTAAASTTTTTSTTTTPTTTTTGALSKGLQVRVWGQGSGPTVPAKLVCADPKAPRPTSTPPLD